MKILTNYDHLLLYNLVEGIEAPEIAFASELADALITHRDVVTAKEPEWGTGLDHVASILRSEVPLHFNHALLRGNDHLNGCFTIRLDARTNVPVMVYAYRNGGGGDQDDPHLGDQGYVLTSEGTRIINRRRDHYQLTVQTIEQILANGGLYGFCAWSYDEATQKFIQA